MWDVGGVAECGAVTLTRRKVKTLIFSSSNEGLLRLHADEEFFILGNSHPATLAMELKGGGRFSFLRGQATPPWEKTCGGEKVHQLIIIVWSSSCAQPSF